MGKKRLGSDPFEMVRVVNQERKKKVGNEEIQRQNT
jgi:hypothetical protein